MHASADCLVLNIQLGNMSGLDLLFESITDTNPSTH
jgi:hypothetical protein